MIKTYIDGMQLPVNPLDDITLTYTANNQLFEVVDIGDVTLMGNRKLTALSIKSIFPASNYSWVEVSNLRDPDYYVSYLTERVERHKPIRLVIIGDGIDINLRCSIESFSPTYKAGETEDCYYSLSLREYRAPSIKRLTIVTPTTAVLGAVTSTASTAKTYTVRIGDSLWGIAQSQLGNGSRYPEIYALNKALMDAKNNAAGTPKYTIYGGQVLTLP
ncbi:MAG: LysM peptidoglycan-binding domain-containing protein [Candidatus Fimivivens sp.]